MRAVLGGLRERQLSLVVYRRPLPEVLADCKAGLATRDSGGRSTNTGPVMAGGLLRLRRVVSLVQVIKHYSGTNRRSLIFSSSKRSSTSRDEASNSSFASNACHRRRRRVQSNRLTSW